MSNQKIICDVEQMHWNAQHWNIKMRRIVQNNLTDENNACRINTYHKVELTF